MEREDDGSRTTVPAALGLLAAAVLAIGIRLLHLAHPGHHYILSPDSHFFHWQAARWLAGDSVPVAWHGGLTYPLAYGARLVGFTCGLSDSSALRVVGTLLPPAIGLVGLVLCLAVVFLRELLDNKIKSEDDIKKYLDLTVVGVIPVYEGGKK